MADVDSTPYVSALHEGSVLSHLMMRIFNLHKVIKVDHYKPTLCFLIL
jgi:hypothetical protein